MCAQGAEPVPGEAKGQGGCRGKGVCGHSAAAGAHAAGERAAAGALRCAALGCWCAVLRYAGLRWAGCWCAALLGWLLVCCAALRWRLVCCSKAGGAETGLCSLLRVGGREWSIPWLPCNLLNADSCATPKRTELTPAPYRTGTLTPALVSLCRHAGAAGSDAAGADGARGLGASP